MSKRAAQTLRDDLEVMRPMRLSEVETAQKEILGVLKRLADSGDLVMASGRGGDEFV
jgi:flagellar motor switch protein FliG